jgi:hypothetical protein
MSPSRIAIPATPMPTSCSASRPRRRARFRPCGLTAAAGSMTSSMQAISRPAPN